MFRTPDRSLRFDVLERHLEESAFLWTQWEAALADAGYTLAEVAEGPEWRLRAHLDALVVAGRGAVTRILLPALEESEPEAMRAAYILKADFGIESRIVNLHTLKPLDKDVIVKAALETGVIVTAEEHQIGGMANYVAAVLAQARELYGKPVITGMIGVKDRFGESGAPWELIKEFEVSGEHIARMAKELYDFKKSR